MTNDYSISNESINLYGEFERRSWMCQSMDGVVGIIDTSSYVKDSTRCGGVLTAYEPCKLCNRISAIMVFEDFTDGSHRDGNEILIEEKRKQEYYEIMPRYGDGR